MASSPRYAPAREDGTKPYVVTVACGIDGCGHPIDRLVYAEGRGDARRVAVGRVSRTYFRACRRATPEDVTNLKEYK